jgi:hypothetical protein
MGRSDQELPLPGRARGPGRPDLGDTPWDLLDCIFIGGSTAFKLGAEAARIVVEAHLLRKWVHMGRVNTQRRLQYAAAIGVDSVDGSGWSRFPADMLRRHGAALRTMAAQRRLIL